MTFELILTPSFTNQGTRCSCQFGMHKLGHSRCIPRRRGPDWQVVREIFTLSFASAIMTACVLGLLVRRRNDLLSFSLQSSAFEGTRMRYTSMAGQNMCAKPLRNRSLVFRRAMWICTTCTGMLICKSPSMIQLLKYNRSFSADKRTPIEVNCLFYAAKILVITDSDLPYSTPLALWLNL